MIKNHDLISSEYLTKEKIFLKIKKNKLNIVLKEEEVGYEDLVKLYFKINTYLKNEDNENIEITFIFRDVKFTDLSTYILFETLIYYMCKRGKFLRLKIKNNTAMAIMENDLEESLIFSKKTAGFKREEFIKKYERFVIDKFKFRKIVKFDSSKPQNASVLYTELDVFLRSLKIKEEIKEQLAEIIVELVSNANEHAQADCLVALKIDEVVKKNDKNQEYYKFSLSIINFSDIILGNGIEKQFNSGNRDLIFIKDLKKAYDNHSKFFNQNYNEKQFFFISAFQWRFSGRSDITRDNGGTGLTTLIKFLIDSAEEDSCYVFSGDSFLIFKKEALLSNNCNYVGFNEKCDYLNEPPNFKLVQKLMFYLHGTLYNFDLILQKEG